MLSHDPSQRRRTFDVDSQAIRDLLCAHWALTGTNADADYRETCLHEIRELILCGGTENNLTEKLAAFDREQGGLYDLYACHVAARALLLL